MFINEVKITLESAHRLYSYRGKCKNIHGHGWEITFGMSSNKLGAVKNTPNGMVMDFGAAKRIIKEVIHDNFDHALILSSKDPLANHLFRFGETLKVMVLPEDYYEPTSENLAKYFFELLRREGIEEKYAVKLEFCKVAETCTYASTYFSPVV